MGKSKRGKRPANDADDRAGKEMMTDVEMTSRFNLIEQSVDKEKQIAHEEVCMKIMSRSAWRCFLACVLTAALIPTPLSAYRGNAGGGALSSPTKGVAIILGSGAAVLVVLLLSLHHRHQPEIQLQAQPGRLSFKGQPGGVADERTVTLKTKGKGALEVTEVSVSSDCFSVSKSSQIPLTLSNRETTQVVVAYKAKPGGCTGNLEVAVQGGKKGSTSLVIPLIGQ